MTFLNLDRVCKHIDINVLCQYCSLAVWHPVASFRSIEPKSFSCTSNQPIVTSTKIFLLKTKLYMQTLRWLEQIYILTAPHHCNNQVCTTTSIISPRSLSGLCQDYHFFTIWSRDKLWPSAPQFQFSPHRNWQTTHKVLREVKLIIRLGSNKKLIRCLKMCFVQIKAVAAFLPKHMTNFALPVFARPQLISEIFQNMCSLSESWLPPEIAAQTLHVLSHKHPGTAWASSILN